MVIIYSDDRIQDFVDRMCGPPIRLRHGFPTDCRDFMIASDDYWSMPAGVG